jgi:hypothetical protein
VSALALEPRLFDPPGSEATLDQRLAVVWERLIGQGAVECPVCGGVMEPEHGAQPGQPDGSGGAPSGELGGRAGRKPQSGRCQACGSTLR